jgi:hypothetical protein
MAWDDEMLTTLRVLIGDLAATPTNSDDALLQVLVVAARQVGLEMSFASPFVADVLNVSITPDPTAAATPDDSYVNLACLKAACIMDRSAATNASSQAIKVVDGRSAVDLTGIANYRTRLLQKGGWCTVYEDQRIAYMSGQVRLAGAAVMTPFRAFAQGYYPGAFGPGRRYPYY